MSMREKVLHLPTSYFGQGGPSGTISFRESLFTEYVLGAKKKRIRILSRVDFVKSSAVNYCRVYSCLTRYPSCLGE